MRLRLLLIIGFISLFSIFLLWFWNKAGDHREMEFTIEDLENENKSKDQVIKINTYQKKLVSKTAVNNDSAARSEWMQLIFEEREAVN